MGKRREELRGEVTQKNPSEEFLAEHELGMDPLHPLV